MTTRGRPTALTSGRPAASPRTNTSPPYGPWALPGGMLGTNETLEASIRRHLATKVDVQELAHLEQLETRSDPARHPQRMIATAYLALVPTHHDPAVPANTAWHPVNALPELAFDHSAIVLAGRERLRPNCPTPTSASRSRRHASPSLSCGRSTGRRSSTSCPPPTCSASCCAGACWNRRAAHALRDGRAAARRRCSGSRASAWRSPTSSPCSAPRADPRRAEGGADQPG